MTTAEAISPPARKLSVVDTLDHARRALSTHRRWLSRRVSTDFGVSIDDDDDGAEVRDKEWRVSDVEDEEEIRNEPEPPVSSAPTTTLAPPTSRRRKVNVVAPAPLLENLIELRGRRGDVEPPITNTRELSWAIGDQQSTYKDDETTNSGREEIKEVPNPKRLKMKWLSSKATVTPVISCPPSDPKNSSSPVPIHLFTSPSTSETHPPLHTKPSSPLLHTHGNPLTAWGSLSSLDKYMESLETGTQDHKPQNTQTLAESNLSSGDESSTSEHDTNIESISKISLFSNPECGLSRELQEEQNMAMESEGMGLDIEALQNESTATILPVSPAPKDQQSSYKAHHYSKLDQVGEGVRIVEVKERSSTELESRSQERIIATKRASLSANTSSTTLEAVLEDVLPCQKSEGEIDVASQPAGHDSELVQPDLTGLEGTEQLASSSPQLQAVVSQEAVNGNCNGLLPEDKSHAHSSSPETSGSQVGGQESQPEEDLSFHPRLTSTPLVPPEPEAEGQTTSERRREILQQLDLPPLKDIKGGSKSVLSRLPRLKSQTPTSPLTPCIELKLSKKRSQDLPPYAHTMAGLALNPPCPRYGVKQIEGSIFQRKRLYSDPSFPQPTSPPPSSLKHKRFSLHSATIKRVSSTTSPSMDEQDGTVVDIPSQGSPPNSPTHNKVQRGDPVQQLRGHRPLRQTVSVPNTGSRGGHDLEGRGTEMRRGSSALDSPLLKSQTRHDRGGSLDATSPRGSVSSLYHMHTGPGPLHLAAKSGNLRQLQVLMSEGGNVDERDHEGRTPLMYCIHSRGVHLSCASLLIQGNAGLDKQSSDGSTVIHLASAVGAIALIELLILNDADPDIRDFEGRLPLHWATMSQTSKCAALLLKHSRLDINAEDDAGMTPLMWAAYNNNPLVTSFLLKQGADCEEKDMDGMTAMHWAVHKDGIRCLELLLKADHTYFKDHRGRTVLHHAAEVGSMMACELVLGLRADAVHDLDRMGRTPLHYAAACSRVDVCALLLDRGCEAAQRDLTGKTAIEYAREKKFDYVVALLTCHETSVADFARASRSTSVSSLLNRATSFSELPLSKEDAHANNVDIITESLQPLPSNKNADATDKGAAMETTHNGSLPYGGGFLGRFVQDNKDPLQNFFFWIMKKSSCLYWSRERDRQRPQGAIVYEVHTGPSESLCQNPEYSPDELHQYVFWVGTDCGVLDLLAYNEEAYQAWISAIGEIVQGKPDGVPEGYGGDKITPGGPKSTQIGTKSEKKKAFRMRKSRSASVAPILEVENEASYTSTGNSRLRTWSDGGHDSESEVELKVTSHIISPHKPRTNSLSRSQGQPQEDSIS